MGRLVCVDAVGEEKNMSQQKMELFPSFESNSRFTRFTVINSAFIRID